jgi:ABC-type uncharacterized transport system involved in gliding motility auxiliary subunit
VAIGTDSSGRSRLIAGGSLAAGIVLVSLLVGFANYFGWKYHRRFDWTASRFYSLSDKTREVLRGLDRDIEAVVFLTPGSQLYPAVSELLARFDAESGRFSVRRIDAERNPAEAKALLDRFEVSELNSVVLEAASGERRVLEEADLAEFDYSGMQFGQGPQIEEFIGEQMFAGAVLELVEDRKPRVLFVVGHGEAAVDDYSPAGLSEAAGLLGHDNFAIEAWTSLGKDTVPEGTDLVVIAGPRVALLEPELEMLRGFVLGGGRLLLLLDPAVGADGLAETGLGNWLEDFGVHLGADIVVDPANPLPFYSAETFFAQDYAPHPITEALEEATYPVVFSLARSLRLDPDSGEGVEVRELVRTSASAWGETGLDHLDSVEQDDLDTAGPLSLAVAIEVAPPSGEPDDALVLVDDEADLEPAPDAGVTALGPAPAAADRPGRVVVFGDSDFASNARLASVGNPTLLLNTINWLAERENLLAIPPRRAEQVQLNLSRAQISSIYWMVLLLMPAASVAAGLLVFLRRRR